MDAKENAAQAHQRQGGTQSNPINGNRSDSLPSAQWQTASPVARLVALTSVLDALTDCQLSPNSLSHIGTLGELLTVAPGIPVERLGQALGFAQGRANGGDGLITRLAEENASWLDSDGSIAGLLASAPPPRKWFVRDRLIAGRGHLLTGIGGSSKSTVLYHLAIGAVLGRLPWNWKIERTGYALLFLTEDTEADAHETLSAMTKVLPEKDRAKLATHLRIWTLAGKDSRLLSLDGQTIYTNERGYGLLGKCAAFRDVAFIGLDPALGLTEGDEMNQAHQRYLGQFVDRLAIETGACTMLVSHATKASANADELTSHQSRGGGGITDAVRGEFVMRTMTTKEAKDYGITDIEERKHHVQLVATKGNRIPPEAFVPVWLRRGAGGVLSEASLELKTGTHAGPSAKDLQILHVLIEMCGSQVPRLEAWRDECIKRGLVSGRAADGGEKAMQRVVYSLRDAGLIEHGLGRGVYAPTEAGYEQKD